MNKTNKITIYHHNSCSKSCNALSVLKQLGEPIERIEYLQEVPSVEDLKSIVRKLNCIPYDLIRKTEPIYLQKFKGKILSDDEWIVAMHENPILIQRPIVIKGDHAVIARSSETLQSLVDYLSQSGDDSPR